VCWEDLLVLYVNSRVSNFQFVDHAEKGCGWNKTLCVQKVVRCLAVWAGTVNQRIAVACISSHACELCELYSNPLHHMCITVWQDLVKFQQAKMWTHADQEAPGRAASTEALSGRSQGVRRRAKWEGDGFLLWACRYLPRLCLRSFGAGRRMSTHGWRSVAAMLALSGILACGIVFDSRQHWLKQDRPSEADRGHVFALEWHTLIPELAPVIEALRACGDLVRESFDEIQVHQLYACDDDEGPFSPACIREASNRLGDIQTPSESALGWYQRHIAARAPRTRPQYCIPRSDSPRLHPEKVSFLGGEHGHGGANASVWVRDFAPCAGGQDRYIVYLRHNASHSAAAAAQDADGPVVAQLGGLSARFRLDHLEELGGTGAGRKGGGAEVGVGGLAQCSRHVQHEVAALGRKYRGFLRYDVGVSLRGVFWYPPGGFDSWHTDGTLVQVLSLSLSLSLPLSVSMTLQARALTF
jgi:hypothetical protein